MLCCRSTRGSLCQAPLCTAYYQGAQCGLLRRTRAEPVYAASYTTRSATWQATPLATTGAVPTRQRLDMLNGRFQEQARKSKREISFTCNAIMYEQYVIINQLGPPIGDPTAMYAPPLRFKREALAVQDRLYRAHSDSH